jgi:hypothetical protein
MEVILNSIFDKTKTMMSTLEVNSQNKDDSIAQEQGEETQQELNTSNMAHKEVTNEKSQDEVKVPVMMSDLNVEQANPSKKSEGDKEAVLPETDGEVSEMTDSLLQVGGIKCWQHLQWQLLWQWKVSMKRRIHTQH